MTRVLAEAAHTLKKENDMYNEVTDNKMPLNIFCGMDTFCE